MHRFSLGPVPPRGTPTPGSWPGVGGGNYSDVGVRDKYLDRAWENRRFFFFTSQKVTYIHYKAMGVFKFFIVNEDDE